MKILDNPVILDIQLTKNMVETNKISVDSVTYTPIYMYNFFQKRCFTKDLKLWI